MTKTTSQAGITSFHKQIKAAGMLIAIGIVFGDIGTSPLYTYTALFKPGEVVNAAKALGVFSCVFWTLTLQTTIKYILITLQADNEAIFKIAYMVMNTRC